MKFYKVYTKIQRGEQTVKMNRTFYTQHAIVEWCTQLIEKESVDSLLAIGPNNEIYCDYQRVQEN